MSSKTRPGSASATEAGSTDWAALDVMSDAEAEAAASADPDCPPASKDSHKMAPVKRQRMALKLSLAEFATRFHIPLATLMAWERHEATPDPVAQAYLSLIAADPDGIAAALAQAATAHAAE